MKLGDKNTKFFQITGSNRFGKNLISSVKVNGKILEEPVLIRNAAVDHFNSCFREECMVRITLNGRFSRKLSAKQAQFLEKQFEEEEIVTTVIDCNSLKSPGPDGFNFSFVKKALNIMKQDIMTFFAEFMSMLT